MELLLKECHKFLGHLLQKISQQTIAKQTIAQQTIAQQVLLFQVSQRATVILIPSTVTTFQVTMYANLINKECFQSQLEIAKQTRKVLTLSLQQPQWQSLLLQYHACDMFKSK